MPPFCLGSKAMADQPENFEKIARRLWDMAQRVGMQVAEKPTGLRDAAFAIVERQVRQMAKEMRIADHRIDAFVRIQMEAVRAMVAQIDASGNPQGGNA